MRTLRCEKGGSAHRAIECVPECDEVDDDAARFMVCNTRAAEKFWLGTHETAWLGRTDVGLMVSHRRLAVRKTLPRSLGPWVLDSGGFSELSLFGEWRTTSPQYVAAVRRYAAEIGQLTWAAPQDWMCEPVMLSRTGLSVAEHQHRTIVSVLELRQRAPALPWIPVLQGWTVRDYLAHADAYAAAGIDLESEAIVGLGSVCRRQGTSLPAQIAQALPTLRLHGFGVKTTGLARYGGLLTSADSLAWSFRARRSPPLAGCTHGSCANCLTFALQWRERVLARNARWTQLALGC